MHVPCYIQTFTLIFFHAKVFIAFLVYVNWIFVHNSTMLTLGNRREFLPFYTICYPCPMFSMVKRDNRSVLSYLFSPIAMVCHFVINVLCFPWSREISDLLSILFISHGLPLCYLMNVFHSQGDNRYLIWYLFCLTAMVCHFVISWMFCMVKGESRLKLCVSNWLSPSALVKKSAFLSTFCVCRCPGRCGSWPGFRWCSQYPGSPGPADPRTPKQNI